MTTPRISDERIAVFTEWIARQPRFDGARVHVHPDDFDALLAEVRAHRARSAQPTPGMEEIEGLVDAFAAAQRGPAKMRPALGTRAALLSAVSRLAARDGR
jgi:hypothetical protein